MYRRILNGYIDFWKFVKSPKNIRDKNQSTNLKVLRVIQFLFLLFFATFFFILIQQVLKNKGLITVSHKSERESAVSSIWMIFFSAVIIAPFLEELIFRYPLRLPKKLLQRIKKFLQKYRMTSWMDSNTTFKIMFYLSTLAFAFVHLINYLNLKGTALFLLPLLIFPQFVAGLCYGYIRIRFNFITGVILHAFFNFILLAVSLLPNGPTTELLNHQEENFNLKIEKINYTLKAKTYAELSSIANRDTLLFPKTDLKEMVAWAKNLKKSQITTNKFTKFRTNLRIEMLIHSEKNFNKNDTILKYLSETFNFSLKDTFSQREVYKLIPVDLEKLKKSKAKDSSMITNSEKEKITFQYVDFKTLGAILSIKLDELVVSDSIEGRFDIELPLEKNKTIRVLEEKYGIKAQKEQQIIKECFIQFED